MNNNLIIRDIKVADVKTMTAWGKFEDKRYHHFNFPYTTNEEFILWYQYKVNGYRQKTYGVFIEQNMIGFITFKKINPILKRAELGIIFDINHISKGYGTIAMKECIRRVGLRKIYLYVSTFNSRAYHTYLKLGFVDKGPVYRVFENQSIIDEIDPDDEDFRKVKGTLYGKYIMMDINCNKMAF